MVEKIHALLDGYLIGRARLKPLIKVMRGSHPEWMVEIRLDLRTLLIEAVLPEAAEPYFLAGCPSVEIFDATVSLRQPQCSFASSAVWNFSVVGLAPLPSTEESWWSPVTEVRSNRYLLQLTPTIYQLELKTDAVLCPDKPYVSFYGDACSRLLPITEFQIGEGLPLVSCVLNEPFPSLLCLSSREDFSHWEERLHAGFMLAHGRVLPLVLEVSGTDVVLCGHVKAGQQNRLPLLSQFSSEEAEELLRQMLQGFCDLRNDEFAHAFFALRFFLLGKTADVPVEVRFLQLMVCVEAMDEVFVLCEKTTAALLGTSPAAAKLLNCMRNKLIHGAGGYLEAFTEVLKKNFKGSLPQLGPGFDDVVIVREELQFTQLWLRLCERLDAFWCGYLKVDPDLLMHRSTWADIALLPAVKMDSFAQLVEQLKENKKRDEQARKEKVAQEKLLQEKVDLERENQSLKEELRKLRSQTVAQMR